MKRIIHLLVMAIFLCALSALGQSQNQPSQPQDPGTQVPPPQSTPPTFPQSKPGKQQPDPQQPSAAQAETQAPTATPNAEQNSARTFMGTIIRSEDSYLLRSGDKEYKLDDQTKVKPFAGKDVKVTGTLDNNVIHVQSIEAQPTL